MFFVMFCFSKSKKYARPFIEYFLFQGLRMNRTLLSLSLASNEIGDKGIIKLGEVCIYERTFKSLSACDELLVEPDNTKTCTANKK